MSKRLPPPLPRLALINCAAIIFGLFALGSAKAQEVVNITQLLRVESGELVASQNNTVFQNEFLTIDSTGSAAVQNSAYVSHAFDGDTTTTINTWSAQWVIGAKPAIVQYIISDDWQPGDEITLTSYRVYYAGTDRPGTWTLSGSNDGGETWTELSSRSGSWSGNYLDVEIPEENQAPYRAYKYHCTANADNGGWVRFAEIEFFGKILESEGDATVSVDAEDNCNLIGITANGTPISSGDAIEKGSIVVVSASSPANTRIVWGGKKPKNAVAGHDPQTGSYTLTFEAKYNTSIKLSAVAAAPSDFSFAPGLLGGYLSGTTSVTEGVEVYPAEESTYFSPEAGECNTSPPWAANRTWVYHGQMFFLNNGVYWFGENIDDAVWLKIDGKVLINDSAYSTPTYGYVVVTDAPKWLDFEVRFYNGTGGAGAQGNNGWTATKGFGCYYNPDTGATSESTHGDGSNFSIPVDPGDGSLFRHQSDALSATDTAIVVDGNPGQYGEVMPTYGFSKDYAAGTPYTFRATKTAWTNAEETIAATLAGYSLYTIDGATQEKSETTTVGGGMATATFTPTAGNASFLTWNWNCEYKITTAFTNDEDFGFTTKIYANGNLVPEGSLVPAGAQIRIVAEGSGDYVPGGWSGTLPAGTDRSQAELTFTLTEPTHAVVRLISSSLEAGLTRYVSPSGDDSSAGITPDAPKATIESAYEAVSATIEELGEDATGIIFIMEGTTILGGTAHEISGNIYWWLDLDKPVTIEGYGARDKCIIEADEAHDHRMHFHISNPDVIIRGVTLTNGRFGYNNDQSNYGAGSIFMDQGVVSNCVIHSNIGGSGGSPGAVRMLNNPTHYPILSDCVITNNRSGQNAASGHGVKIQGGTASTSGISALVEKCFFDNNRNGDTSYNYSSATLSIQGTESRGAVVRDSVISRDTSYWTNGGAISMAAGLVERCVLTNNTNTSNGGAGVYITGGALVNCYIANNKAKNSGGGIFAQNNGTTFIINNTIVQNESENDEFGGIYVSGTGHILLNNISYGNKKGSDSPKRNIAFASTANSGKFIDYNCFVPATSLDDAKAGVAGANNLFVDPLFKEITALKGYELLPSSPCIDTAATPEMMVSAGYITAVQMQSAPLCNADFFKDVEQTARPKHGNPALEEAIDIGAYESPSFMEGDFGVSFSQDIYTAQQPLDADNIKTDEDLVAVTFTPIVSGEGTVDPDSEIILTWSATDVHGQTRTIGTTSPTDANGGALTANFSVGCYDITVSAHNAKTDADASFTLEKTVKISAPWAYVSKTGNAVFPYYTLEDAARYADEAIGALCPADDEKNGTHSTVYVTEGEYNVRGSHIVLSSPITVKSLLGPEKTAFVAHGADDPETQGKATKRKIIAVDNADAILDGFTLKGATRHEVGAVMLYNGTITNCIISENVTPANNNTAGLYMTGGLLADCILRENTTTYKWDNAHAIYITGGIVSSCSIINNGNSTTGGGNIYGVINMNGGMLTNCVISDNYVNRYWDGYYGAIYMHNANAKVINCTITNNYSSCANDELFASGIFMQSGLLRQCLIAGNYAPENATGTIGLRQEGGTVESCTIADNGLSSPNATGVYMKGGTAVNNIYHGNANGDLTISQDTVANNITYCCFADADKAPFNGDDAHNIADNPRLTRKYTLGGRSPLRSMGLLQPWMEGALDLQGNPRIRIAPELGCYELPDSGPTMLLLR